jgi:hypothetical protein
MGRRRASRRSLVPAARKARTTKRKEGNMTLFEALKLIVLGALLLFLATKCVGKDHFKAERLRATSTDVTPKSPR